MLNFSIFNREQLKAYKSCKTKYVNTPGFFDEFCAKLACDLLIDIYGMFPCNCDSIGKKLDKFEQKNLSLLLLILCSVSMK